MRLAGLGGLVGGVGGLLASLGGLGAIGLPIGDSGVGVTPGVVIVLYPVWHLLFAVGLLAANAWFGSSYGRTGRVVATVLALTLVGEAVSILVLVVARIGVGEFLLPIGIIHATTWMAIRLFGSLHGVSLWRHGNVSRLTAGLFVVLFPAIFVLAPLTQIGFPSVLIVAPLDLAFVALGYELWTDAAGATSRGTEVTG